MSIEDVDYAYKQGSYDEFERLLSCLGKNIAIKRYYEAAGLDTALTQKDPKDVYRNFGKQVMSDLMVATTGQSSVSRSLTFDDMENSGVVVSVDHQSVVFRVAYDSSPVMVTKDEANMLLDTPS